MSDSDLHLVGNRADTRPIDILTQPVLRREFPVDRKRADQALEEMRREIAEIDRAFLELLRQRMDLSAGIGRIKAATGQAIFVPEVHERVLARARHNARICGVSEKVMEAIYEAVMLGSIERQHRVVGELRACVLGDSRERIHSAG